MRKKKSKVFHRSLLNFVEVLAHWYHVHVLNVDEWSNELHDKLALKPTSVLSIKLGTTEEDRKTISNNTEQQHYNLLAVGFAT